MVEERLTFFYALRKTVHCNSYRWASPHLNTKVHSKLFQSRGTASPGESFGSIGNRGALCDIVSARMPANIEIKARLCDPAAAEAIAIRLCDFGPELIHQEDVFFHAEAVRLKLRIFTPDCGELIRYERADTADARLSQYAIAATSNPQALLEILSKLLGVAGVVKKDRTLYLMGQTRVHIDRVEDLGDFLELEVVLRPGQSADEGKVIAEALLIEFGIGADQLIGEAYIDLLSGRARASSE
jgi:predicted adenylyl cyclase CyaB